MKAGKVFNVVPTLVKDYAKYDGQNFEHVRIFLSDSQGTGKSQFHLVKAIYTRSKTLLYH